MTGEVAKVMEPVSNHKELVDFEAPQKRPKRNKFAFACASLASMTSILLGYGNPLVSPSLFLMHVAYM